MGTTSMNVLFEPHLRCDFYLSRGISSNTKLPENIQLCARSSCVQTALRTRSIQHGLASYASVGHQWPVRTPRQYVYSLKCHCFINCCPPLPGARGDIWGADICSLQWLATLCVRHSAGNPLPTIRVSMCTTAPNQCAPVRRDCC